MDFSEFKKLFQKNFEEMTKDADNLFEVAIDKDEFWNLYLDSFPAGTNEVYRSRREYDCSCCRHFIKSIGNAVVIKNNKIRTMWGFVTGDDTFQPVINTLNKYLLSKCVTDVYVSKFKNVGTDNNYEEINGQIQEWEHFYLRLPNKFVDNTNKSIGEIQGEFRDTRNVFKRSLDEINEDAINTVLELIASNSLYRGEEWKAVLEKFLEYKKQYDKLPTEDKDNYAWENSSKAGVAIGRIRNHSVGTLLVDISNNVDLDTAVKRYEAIVAPANYKRPKAIFTKKMLEDAKKTIDELGYTDSLARRFATIDDISVNNILYANRNVVARMSDTHDVFAEMMSETKSTAKKFSKVEEVPINKFVTNILPTAQDLEVYLENKHEGNMVSLIAPKNPDSKTMFKWNNGFSWAYTGNMTDSSMKERVKAAGGKVDGVLRFTIQWNDMKNWDKNDLDAHCIEPSHEHIYYGSAARKPGYSRTGGQLDVDIINPSKGCPAVENITWGNKSRMKPGVYKFYVKQFCNRGGTEGFRAEIEFDGTIYSFNYPKELRAKEEIVVATVTLNTNGTFSIKEALPSSTSSKQIWGLTTNEFVPVSVVMYSPNYWDEQAGIGNKHYFFMLKNCVNPDTPHGFYNEFLKNDLDKHKRVFEALGGKMAVESVENQLSGLGFSSTMRNDLIVKVKGSTERVMKVKF